MEHSSNRAASETGPFSGNGTGHTQERLHQALRFPGEDGGQSLTEMAKLDLQATLQLLVERTQYITGATGAAIALWEEELMVCRASAGSSAPELGAHLQVNSGLSRESVRLRQTLRCDDTETDPRVNRESCRQSGIASVLVLPLIGEQEVIGVFELFSDKRNGFAERDVAALERMGEMIRTALAHADAAKQVEWAQKQPASPLELPLVEDRSFAVEGIKDEDSILSVEDSKPPAGAKGVVIPIRHEAADLELPPPFLAGEIAKIGKCEACGFPVSPGRVLCVDCEQGRTPASQSPSATRVASAVNEPAPEPRQGVAEARDVPAFLSQYGEVQEEKSGWLASHKFWFGAAMLAIAAALLLLLARAGVVRLPS